MKFSSPSARSITTGLILLVGLSGLQGCNETSSAPKDAAADPATIAAGKAVDDAVAKRAGKKVPKSIKDLGK